MSIYNEPKPPLRLTSRHPSELVASNSHRFKTHNTIVPKPEQASFITP
jgi:hypothetical protein